MTPLHPGCRRMKAMVVSQQLPKGADSRGNRPVIFLHSQCPAMRTCVQGELGGFQLEAPDHFI